ncbi:dUTP diphosphatase [Acidithrix ferrooxidans]|uniref:dUTP diphosphatase n=1 Tax=Acidithrix ferrooxidans TaxID=1280514 RepID=UPI0009E24EEB|nr:dUTP diphosphatase [Acidithrix ferrooxidans]
MSVIRYRRVDPRGKVPRYAHDGDGGCDLYSIQSYLLEPLQRATIRTGIVLEIPMGFGGLILPRSGLASKFGVTLSNSPGLIDSGYRGELMVALINLDPKNSFAIEEGMRIAQLVIVEVSQFIFEEVEELEGTDRDRGGFGSSGLG